MKATGPFVAECPGNPPRAVGLRRLWRGLPGSLQIMVIVYPLVCIAVLIWILSSFSKHSFTSCFVAAVCGPNYAGMILWRWRQLRHWPATLGQITRVGRGRGDDSDCKLVGFDYTVGVRKFSGEHLTLDPRGAVTGDEIWVLFNPADPQKSIVWMYV